MKNIIYLILVFAFSLSACKEELVNEPISKSDAVPLQVANVLVESLPGGGKLTYQLPNDRNLLMVKAVYVMPDGVERNAVASAKTNTLSIDGLVATTPCLVKLYSVSYSGVLSAPVEVSFTPLTSPLNAVFATAGLKETFGGVAFSFKNITEANLSMQIVVNYPDKNKFVEAKTFYTKSAGTSFSVRGFPHQELTFGVVIRDRWNNKTDTLFRTCTPYEELQLNRTTWKRLDLFDPTDPIAQIAGAANRAIGQTKNRDYTTNYADGATNPIENLWNNKYATSGTTNGQDIFFPAYHGMPMNFAFSLGYKANLSRIVIYPRITAFATATDGAFGNGDPRIFEIWGCDNLDPTKWTFDQWTLLKTCEVKKPSGLPYSTNAAENTSAEDRTFAYAGYEFEFDPGTIATRYIRIRVKETWGGQGQINYYLNELFLYGAPTQ